MAARERAKGGVMTRDTPDLAPIRKRLAECPDQVYLAGNTIWHYKRDLTAVLRDHDAIEEKTARRCAQIADNYIGAGVAGATIRREFKL